jgi:cytochrome P450
MILPLGTPIKGVDGTEMHEIPIPKDTTILINVTACNSNPSIWGDDSHQWKPERWLEPLPESVSSAHIPGVFSHLLVVIFN